jgi:hypothetical protein
VATTTILRDVGGDQLLLELVRAIEQRCGALECADHALGGARLLDDDLVAAGQFALLAARKAKQSRAVGQPRPVLPSVGRDDGARASSDRVPVPRSWRRTDEIVARQAAHVMRAVTDLDPAVADFEIRVVVFAFSEAGDGVDEEQRRRRSWQRRSPCAGRLPCGNRRQPGRQASNAERAARDRARCSLPRKGRQCSPRQVPVCGGHGQESPVTAESRPCRRAMRSAAGGCES